MSDMNNVLTEKEKSLILSLLENMEEERTENFKKAIENFDSEEEVHRRFDPGTMGSHEAADRTWMFVESIDHYVTTHPTVVMNKEAYRLVSMAVGLLHDAYQVIACADFDHHNKDTDNEPHGDS